MKQLAVGLGIGLGVAALALVVQLALWSTLPPTPFLFAYPAVVFAAWWAGRTGGGAAVLTSALALLYWFLPPTPSFSVGTWRDILDLALFCAMSLLVVELIVRVKKALHDAKAAAQRAESATSARDVVLAVVAHDLRNPLQTIGLNAELLASDLAKDDARAGAAMLRIRRAAAQARRLVENVLDSARIDATPFPVQVETTSLASLVGDCLAPFDALAAARSIALEPPSPETVRGSIVCDRERIIQVLSNLVSNAIQYTPRGGRVVVAVQRSAEGIRFDVTDTGRGMTEQDVAHAFDRLWYGSGPGHGSGLGLWIAKALVAAHGGTIEATSKPGKGTHMTFDVPQPAAAEAATPSGQREAVA